MHPVYALEDLPDPCRASLFLAGPTPRDPVTPSWRPEALRLLGLHGARTEEEQVVPLLVTPGTG